LTVDTSLTVTSLALGTQTITVNTGNTLTVNRAAVSGGTINGDGELAVVAAAGAQGSLQVPAIASLTSLDVSFLSIDANSALGIAANTNLFGVEVTNDGAINWTTGDLGLGVEYAS
jgi:hypothetical protein